MIINNNLMSINSHRHLTRSRVNAKNSMEKLSSGFRINRAGDDAAGLSISEKMRGQIRGLRQASRNAQDAISMIQTAEGALTETHSALQRMRELAVQASSDTNTDDDRNVIQNEIEQLTDEIDRIANTTEFNTISLLNRNPSVSIEETDLIISNLKKWWLVEAENLVREGYGIEADGVNMEVEIFDDPDHPAAALVRAEYTTEEGNTTGIPDITGKGSNLRLEINLAHAQPVDSGKDGGSPPQYVSRVIAHEMAHAVMMRTMNFADLPIWFNEGTAEFIHGADERLMNNIYIEGFQGSNFEEAEKNAGLSAVVNSIGDGNYGDWEGTSLDYSSAYVATRYLDWQIRQNDLTNSGNTEDPDGIKAVMDYLSTNPTDNLDDALSELNSQDKISFANTEGWIQAFKNDVTMATLESKTGIQLSFNVVDNKFVAEDTGSIVGSSITGGEHKSAEDILPQAGGEDAPEVEQPLQGFNMIWPDGNELEASEGAINFHIGANKGQSIKLELSDMRASSLGIREAGNSLDLTKQESADEAITKIDDAIIKLSDERSKLGAIQNRLEISVNNLNNTSENLQAAESRIRDVDMAQEMVEFTKQNILQQASTAMLAQANMAPQIILQLLG